jgi:hypothetical protein
VFAPRLGPARRPGKVAERPDRPSSAVHPLVSALPTARSSVYWGDLESGRHLAPGGDLGNHALPR